MPNDANAQNVAQPKLRSATLIVPQKLIDILCVMPSEASNEVEEETLVLVNHLGLRLPRQKGTSRTKLAYFYAPVTIVRGH